MLLKNIMKGKALSHLIEKFKEIDIMTQESDWICVIENPIYESSTWYSTKKFQFRYSNKELGFIDAYTHKEDISITLGILDMFRHASKSENFSLIKKLFNILIRESNNPNMGYYEEVETNLTGAIKTGNLEIVQYLVENGVSIHSEYEINTIVALKNKHYHIVEYFLDTDLRIDLKHVLRDDTLSSDMINFIQKWQLQRTMKVELEEKVITKKSVKI